MHARRAGRLQPAARCGAAAPAAAPCAGATHPRTLEVTPGSAAPPQDNDNLLGRRDLQHAVDSLGDAAVPNPYAGLLREMDATHVQARKPCRDCSHRTH